MKHLKEQCDNTSQCTVCGKIFTIALSVQNLKYDTNSAVAKKYVFKTYGRI